MNSSALHFYKVVHIISEQTGVGDDFSSAAASAVGKQKLRKMKAKLDEHKTGWYWTDYKSRSLVGGVRTRTTQLRSQMYEVAEVYNDETKSKHIFTVFRAENRRVLSLLPENNPTQLAPVAKRKHGRKGN